MTDLSPVDAMTTLSPAAAAVLRAAGDSDPGIYATIAAALQAAADQVAPETPPSQLGDPEILVGIWGERRIIRQDLLAIAAELENQ